MELRSFSELPFTPEPGRTVARWPVSKATTVPSRGELGRFVTMCAPQWALNSAVECHLHTVEVIGSNPIAPTIFSTAYDPLSDHLLIF